MPAPALPRLVPAWITRASVVLLGLLGLVVPLLLAPGVDARPLPTEPRPEPIPMRTVLTTLPVLRFALHKTPGHGVWPLAPRPDVVARFDPPSTRFGPGHRGVDLLGHPGQPVRAALAGRVSFAGVVAGRGVVVVDHGSTRTTYEPVHATVHRGDAVEAGQVLGRLQTGRSHCFPRTCLHWGLIEGADHYLDPLTLVGAGPVRLLALPR